MDNFTKPRAYKSLNSSETILEHKREYSVTLKDYQLNKFVEMWSWSTENKEIKILSSNFSTLKISTGEDSINKLKQNFDCVVENLF